jgi:hypothetical protein
MPPLPKAPPTMFRTLPKSEIRRARAEHTVAAAR